MEHNEEGIILAPDLQRASEAALIEAEKNDNFDFSEIEGTDGLWLLFKIDGPKHKALIGISGVLIFPIKGYDQYAICPKPKE